MTSSWILLWQELRKRVFIWLSCLASFAVFLLPFANSLFIFFAHPLLHTLNNSQHLIATGILSGFWIPIELSLWFALLLSAPLFIWQFWSFIKPALTKTEKIWWKIYLGGSLGLFFLGLAFAYWVALPICLHILVHATPLLVNVMPDITNYLNFSFRLIISFGLATQLPLIILLLCQLKLVRVEELKKIRRYIIIGAFVIGMIIAPDVISQCLLAIPLCLLFELGILLAKFRILR